MRHRWRGALWLCGVLALSATASAAEYQPDDTGDVAAIQNRTYHLGQEFDFSLSFLPLDAFYKAVAPEIAYSFHFTDSLAWEAIRFGYGLAWDTGLKTQLLSLGAQPTALEQIKLFLASNVTWAPLYAKGAIVNKYVIYGEIYGAIGGAAFDTNQAWRPAGDVALGGRVFLNKVLSLKVEAREYLLFEQSLPSVVDLNIGLAINFGANE